MEYTTRPLDGREAALARNGTRPELLGAGSIGMLPEVPGNLTDMFAGWRNTLPGSADEPLRRECAGITRALFENSAPPQQGLRADTESHAYLIVPEENSTFSVRVFGRESLDSFLEHRGHLLSGLLVCPGRQPEEILLPDTLESLQHQVGGYVEAVYPFREDDAVLLCNEEGKLDGLPLNRALYDDAGEISDIVAGSFLLLGSEADGFCSLTPEQQERYAARFRQPESFYRIDGKLTAVPEPEDLRYTAVPLYRESSIYASSHGEKEQYLRSYQANCACRRAIEQAVSENCRDGRLYTDGARDVADRFGTERTYYVLANTVQRSCTDSRWSPAALDWAASVRIPQDRANAAFAADRCHPALAELFLNQIRRLEKAPLQRASVLDKLNEPASAEKTHRVPEKEAPVR